LIDNLTSYHDVYILGHLHFCQRFPLILLCCTFDVWKIWLNLRIYYVNICHQFELFFYSNYIASLEIVLVILCSSYAFYVHLTLILSLCSSYVHLILFSYYVYVHLTFMFTLRLCSSYIHIILLFILRSSYIIVNMFVLRLQYPQSFIQSLPNSLYLIMQSHWLLIKCQRRSSKCCLSTVKNTINTSNWFDTDLFSCLHRFHKQHQRWLREKRWPI
jgi:hypothetical protein